ncbi:MAG: acetate--CoA ligase [Desulfohalobiaceae bacterium]
MSEQKERIEHMLDENRVFQPPREGRDQAHVKSMEEYEAHYKRSMEDPDGFWRDRADELITWYKEPGKILEWDFHKPEIKWYQGGQLNVSYNCLDRHLENGKADKTAIIWQGEKEDAVKTFTYQELHAEVCRFANVLKKLGVKKGDRVSIYLPMVPELVVAMLACARIGAPHSIVFAGFSANSLRDRINDCEAKVLVAGNGVFRAGKSIPLKPNVDTALEECPTVEKVVLVTSCDNDVNVVQGRDLSWDELMQDPELPDQCEPEVMDAEDVLFILYTSGSTGKPKGVYHTSAGYLVYSAHTSQWVFDLHDDDIHWCTADIGWVTGHTYITYGPLALGMTSLMFEGVPTYPEPNRFWQICEKFKVTVFYTAPTVIRSLMRLGEKWTQQNDLSSLRVLGSVGEPINPQAWMWYYINIGREKLPVVDTWWQTETGGIMISALPYATPLKPGSATKPLPGVDASIVTKEGEEVDQGGGFLVINKPWPGMLRGVWGDPERFKQQYFAGFPGVYESGDGARVDEDGYFWIMGRIDDVINVSGHRMGTAEIESALVSHPAVSEAAVVGMPHEVKGQTIYAYVTLKEDQEPSDELMVELKKHVRSEIGPIATPEFVQFSPGLPKTRSGKIMRRILRKIASDDTETIGDTSTLADPSVISDLIEGKVSTVKK